MMTLGDALLLLVALLICADKGLTTSSCNGPRWQRYVDQSSLGARRHSGPASIKECLNHCIQTSGCVAVDVEVNNFPPGCWLHFDASHLVDSNTFFLAGTNQYRLVDRCPNATASCNQSEWERYYGYTALGATEYVGPRTIRQCLDYCERTSSCVGVDIDVNVLPLRCWPHLSANDMRPDNVYRQPNTSHYRLVGRCPNATRTAGCYNPEWEIHENKNSVGASEYGAAKSVHECLDYCGSQSSCVAVDVDLTRQPPTCWPHLSADDLLPRNVYSQPGTNQYRLRERCVNNTAAGGCRKSVWKILRGSTALGGTQYVGPRTIQQCLDYCNTTASCVAVDIDVNVVPLRCWTHVNRDDLRPDNIYSQQGTDHYELVSRCPNAAQASGCYNPEWEIHENQNSLGATQHSGTQSVHECLDYCGSQSSCVAVDVDLTQQPPICWPHLSADDLLDRNVYSQPGTNQYRLIKRCASGPITVTTTPNTATTTLGPNCRQSEWKKRVGHTALGGTQYVGPRTIQQCLDYCNATASCVGVDIDVNVVPLRCWTHVNRDDLRPDNIFSQRGTDHYQLINRCPNARDTSDCYNPEWEVLENQNSVGSSQYVEANSVQECLDYCGSQSSCVAVDVDLTQQPPTCWPHLSADDLLDRNVYSQPGTNQYRLRKRCVDFNKGPNCRQSEWKKRVGHTALGGRLYDGPRTIQQCLDYCNATASCVGVDIDVNVVPLRCWTHVDRDDLRPDNIYSQQGTDHYKLITRCPNPRKASECYNPDWEIIENQNSVGATQYSAANSVHECLDYCGSQSSCVAVDVDLTQQPPTCWPHLSADDLLDHNVYSQPGTNQYRLRDRCVAGAATRTSAPGTTTTGGRHSSGVIIGLAVGLGVPLAVILVFFIIVLLLLCIYMRRGGDGSSKITPVEAINTFISWPSKNIGSRAGTMRSSTTDLYPPKDVDSVCGTTSNRSGSDYSPPV